MRKIQVVKKSQTEKLVITRIEDKSCPLVNRWNQTVNHRLHNRTFNSSKSTARRILGGR